MDVFRRNPYREKEIKNISKKDILISVSGVVVNKGESSFMIDDGSGQVAVLYDKSVNEGDYVRVLGMVIGDGEIKAEIVQDLNKIDKKLHRKVIKLLE